MKGLGVYKHCAKGESITHFGPRAMVPSPHEHWGLICVLYNIQGSWGSPKITQFMIKLTKKMISMTFGMV
jgi:hypothetical protein